MKHFSIKRTILCSSLMFLASVAFMDTASAQVYYPMQVAVTSPEGAVQYHTIYVPAGTQSGVSYQTQQVLMPDANGNMVATTIYIPATTSGSTPSTNTSDFQLASNPWDDSVQPEAVMANTSPQMVAGANNTLSASVSPVALATTRTSANTVATYGTLGTSGTTTTNTTGARDEALPTWVGHNTTYNTAMGQEMIAPEVNKANMLSMVAHLRKIGYIVPDSLDQAIRDAPSKTKVAMLNALGWVQGGGDAGSFPVIKALGQASKDLENNYGFTFDNILGNSLSILDER